MSCEQLVEGDRYNAITGPRFPFDPAQKFPNMAGDDPRGHFASLGELGNPPADQMGSQFGPRAPLTSGMFSNISPFANNTK